MEYIAFDSHKHYTLASVDDGHGRVVNEQRIAHRRGAIKDFLAQRETGSPVALETVGNWSWIADEIEAAGMAPRLVHARKAKLMMGMLNKTDRLDARGLNRLQRAGTLPKVWLPPGPVRDRRELPRLRMVLTGQRTQLKNRLQAMLAKHALAVEGVSDVFGKRCERLLQERIAELPPEAGYAARAVLAQVMALRSEITALEARIRTTLKSDPHTERFKTLPGVGDILAAVILAEVGDVDRFACASRLASYAGTTPRVHASGDKVRLGQTRPDVNRYLKLAFVEAGNVCARHAGRWPDRHVSRLYRRIRARKGHQKAVGAVARHLAEATFAVLKHEQPYRDPALTPASPMQR
jgi:transposase